MKSYFKLAALVSFLSIINLGCWSTQTHIIGPDGSSMIAIRCGGSWGDTTQCLEEAGLACPNGYNIINASSGEGTGIIWNNQGGQTVRTFRGQMLISCKELPKAESKTNCMTPGYACDETSKCSSEGTCVHKFDYYK